MVVRFRSISESREGDVSSVFVLVWGEAWGVVVVVI